MALTPEQRAAWEREKQERAQRELSEQERELKRRRDEALIDRAIRKAERLQKIRKWTYIAVVVIYLAAVGLYFVALKLLSSGLD